MLRISRALAIAKVALALAAGATQPNVVVVVSDADGIEALPGHLRDGSTRLRDFRAAPGRAMHAAELLSGHPAFSSGVCADSGGRNLLRPDVSTLAGRFRAAGHATAIFGNWQLGEAFPCRPEDQGFGKVEVVANGGADAVGNPWSSTREQPLLRTRDGWKLGGSPLPEAFFEAAGRWIDERAAADESFFLWVAAGDPEADAEAQRERLANGIGQLIERLGELGVAEETLVVLAGDIATDGAADGRVPLAFRWPGTIPGGRSLDGLAGPQDLAPTLAGLCGLEAVATSGGADWSAALLGSGEGPGDRTLVTQAGAWPADESPVRQRSQSFVVRRANWRLEGLELFDTSADPGERKNHFTDQPQLAQSMLIDYGRWWERVLPGLQEPVRYRVGGEQQSLVALTAHDWWPSLDGPVGGAGPPRQRAELEGYLSSLRDPDKRAELSPWIGHWKLEALRSGHYRVILSLLPADAPEQDREQLGTLRDGVVELRTRQQSLRGKIGSGFQRVQIGIDLEPGPFELEAWFGGQLPGEARVGAFFATLERVGERRSPLPDLEFDLIPENR